MNPSNSFPTPGVYVQEIGAFPNSVVPVATAVPAFIGYTPQATFGGRSCTGQPVRITSLQEFMTCFALLDPATGAPLPETAQNPARYYPIPASTPASADIVFGGQGYDIEPDPGTVYYLYQSIKLFYANGGGDCYVVSVGPYGTATGSPKAKTGPLINPNIRVADLVGALASLLPQGDVTLIVVPDATLLSPADNGTLNQQILLHCQTTASRVALFDIVGGDSPDPVKWFDDIQAFRSAIGLAALDYGAAYYPFLRTTVLVDGDIDFNTLGGGKTLSTVLPGADRDPLKTLLADIPNAGQPGFPTHTQIEGALLNASSEYSQLHDAVLARMNVLPAAGAMAGAYALNDSEKGVWQAPANIGLISVIDVTLKLTDTTQAPLNIDAASGKSINAIRLFPGKGVVVWGARTLDGNSDDWRYVNVRRTVIMLEQSMKAACNAYVFQPNNATTWSLVQSMLSNFLTSQWQQGALVGATPAAAFSVAVGLGVTMTGEDILNGVMNVSVKVAITHPAEFIVINLQQQMQS
jgi:phage tail sheath protein FI